MRLGMPSSSSRSASSWFDALGGGNLWGLCVLHVWVDGWMGVSVEGWACWRGVPEEARGSRRRHRLAVALRIVRHDRRPQNRVHPPIHLAPLLACLQVSCLRGAFHRVLCVLASVGGARRSRSVERSDAAASWFDLPVRAWPFV